jgi:hypothetical protein
MDGYPVPEWWPSEVAADNTLANSITTNASTVGYSAYNWYGAQTTASNIYTAAAGNGAPYAGGVPHSITFYIGHGGITTYYSVQPPFAFNQYFILDNNGGSVYDNDIWGYTASMETNFAFLWSCEQGDEIGGTNWYWYLPPATLAYGMPHAWLHTTSLSSDGYTNPDTSNLCFIGFQGGAPGLILNFTQTLDGQWTWNNNFANGILYFLEVFYSDALVKGYSVNNALDAAAQQTWAIPSFNYTDLHNGWLGTGGKMIVYGDGNIQLKSVNPLFAMKTLVNGNFYKPNVTVPFMKIEEWFTNSSAEGDQVETSVVGYPFTFPNGVVGLTDLVALALAYGTHEGGPKWSYQEDIVPDRNVDLGDLTVLAHNYGKGGSWYSTVLSGIYISFNFADGSKLTEWPDSNGFVAVPWNCTGWTVYQQHGWPWPDTTVGAFITFWG